LEEEKVEFKCDIVTEEKGLWNMGGLSQRVVWEA